MLIQVEDLQKEYGDRLLFSHVSFQIGDSKHMGLVGRNGQGKSTLLKLIMNEELPDFGEITIGKNVNVGYLPQICQMDSERTIYEEFQLPKADLIRKEEILREMEHNMEKLSEEEWTDYHRKLEEFKDLDGYSLPSKIKGIAKGLGFLEEELSQAVSTLSGGQKTRVALGKLLVQEPDLLILDEPTNHLDMEGIQWLESYLSSYKGGILLVSHDRYFLDHVVTEILDLDDQTTRVYKGNYSQFMEKKEQLARIHTMPGIKIHLKSGEETGKDVVQVTNVSKGFEDSLFEQVNFEIKKGERVALLGKNGTGKSTFLKILKGNLNPDSGVIRFGTHVKIGYYDQELQNLSHEKTLFDEIHDTYPTLTHTEVRNALAAFLFQKDDVFLQVSDLSGGERARLTMAKVILDQPNLLLMDEPTNHLDMESCEILEQALLNFNGTLFFVSHDRYFVKKIATRILELHEKNMLDIPGNYEYYLEKKELYIHKTKPVHSTDPSRSFAEGSTGKESFARNKKLSNQRNKQKRELKKAEETMHDLEETMHGLEEQMKDPSINTDPDKMLEISNRLEEINAQWEEQFMIYSQLSEEVNP